MTGSAECGASCGAARTRIALRSIRATSGTVDAPMRGRCRARRGCPDGVPPGPIRSIVERPGGPAQRRSTMKVKDAMHKGVDWVSPDTPVTELAKLMCEHDIGAIPIGENDRL